MPLSRALVWQLLAKLPKVLRFRLCQSGFLIKKSIPSPITRNISLYCKRIVARTTTASCQYLLYDRMEMNLSSLLTGIPILAMTQMITNMSQNKSPRVWIKISQPPYFGTIPPTVRPHSALTSTRVGWYSDLGVHRSSSRAAHPMAIAPLPRFLMSAV